MMKIVTSAFVALVLVASVSGKPIKPDCEAAGQNLTMISLSTGKYYFSDTYNYYTWDDGFNFCKENGLELVTVNDDEEMTTLWAEHQSMRWTSGRWVYDEIKPPGEFQWEGGATISTSSDMWMMDEPNDYLNGFHCCVTLYSGKIMDDPCKLSRSFICEVPESCYA